MDEGEIEEKADELARRLKGEPTLKAAMEYPQEILVEGNPEIEDTILNYSMEHGVANGVSALTKERISFRSSIKTGDGGDSPYAPSKEGLREYWEMASSYQCVSTEGKMRWSHLTYCYPCDELYNKDEYDIIRGEDGRLAPICPKCKEDLAVATAPKWMYFEEEVEFEEKLNTIEDLERELERILGLEDMGIS